MPDQIYRLESKPVKNVSAMRVHRAEPHHPRAGVNVRKEETGDVHRPHVYHLAPHTHESEW